MGQMDYKSKPVAYFIEVMRIIVLKESGFADIKFHLLSVLGLAVVFNSWAIMNYHKRSLVQRVGHYL